VKTVAAVLVSSIVLAGGAWAADTHTSGGPTTAQFNALKKQVAALQKQNNTILAATAALVIFDKKCVDSWKAVTDYNGYGYTFSDSTTGQTTALDLAQSGETPIGYVPVAGSDCTNALRR
jgi:hypothetical protein